MNTDKLQENSQNPAGTDRELSPWLLGHLNQRTITSVRPLINRQYFPVSRVKNSQITGPVNSWLLTLSGRISSRHSRTSPAIPLSRTYDFLNRRYSSSLSVWRKLDLLWSRQKQQRSVNAIWPSSVYSSRMAESVPFNTEMPGISNKDYSAATVSPDDTLSFEEKPEYLLTPESGYKAASEESRDLKKGAASKVLPDFSPFSGTPGSDDRNTIESLPSGELPEEAPPKMPPDPGATASQPPLRTVTAQTAQDHVQLYSSSESFPAITRIDTRIIRDFLTEKSIISNRLRISPTVKQIPNGVLPASPSLMNAASGPEYPADHQHTYPPRSMNILRKTYPEDKSTAYRGLPFINDRNVTGDPVRKTENTIQRKLIGTRYSPMKSTVIPDLTVTRRLEAAGDYSPEETGIPVLESASVAEDNTEIKLIPGNYKKSRAGDSIVQEDPGGYAEKLPRNQSSSGIKSIPGLSSPEEISHRHPVSPGRKGAPPARPLLPNEYTPSAASLFPDTGENNTRLSRSSRTLSPPSLSPMQSLQSPESTESPEYKEYSAAMQLVRSPSLAGDYITGRKSVDIRISRKALPKQDGKNPAGDISSSSTDDRSFNPVIRDEYNEVYSLSETPGDKPASPEQLEVSGNPVDRIFRPSKPTGKLSGPLELAVQRLPILPAIQPEPVETISQGLSRSFDKPDTVRKKSPGFPALNLTVAANAPPKPDTGVAQSEGLLERTSHITYQNIHPGNKSVISRSISPGSQDSTNESLPDSSESQSQGESGPNTDLKTLAREIYPFIKRMIMVEKERLPF